MEVKPPPNSIPHLAAAELLGNVVRKSYATAGISKAASASWETTKHASYTEKLRKIIRRVTSKCADGRFLT